MDVILTHENADFDAVAAEVAAHKLFPAYLPVLPRRLNRNVRDFLTLYGGEFSLAEVADLPREHIERVILVDTQTTVMPKGMNEQSSVRIIDHHPLNRELPPGWSYTGETVGATTTLLSEHIQAGGLHVRPIEATLLLLGIYEDTGSLTYLTTEARDARCVAWLLEQGASLEMAREFLNHPLAEDQRELFERLVENAKTYTFQGQSVVLAMAQMPGVVEEISTLAHRLRDLFDPDALFLLVGMDDHIQMVARSTAETIDVAQITAHFGGGGHARAAAALIRERNLAEVQQELLDILPRMVRPAVRVSQIMSRGVRTLTPETTIRQAAEEMQRYGYEGFPVESGGQIAGLLTRRAVDRAMGHKLDGAAVKQFMEKGGYCVQPGDSIVQLQQIMVTSGWGQVPVVEDGRIVGIVTRTDLLKLLSAPPQHPRREEIARLLDQRLSEPLSRLIHVISQAGAELGSPVYFVGGLVRDLLLGQPIVDIDLVVEGDAIRLARRLATAHRGRIVAHERFGTARWILEGSEDFRPGDRGLDGDRIAIPEALDLVSARTEFYAAPSVLPEVQHSSIKLDLHRRDFTINTLAISLAPDSYGRLLDFWGGEKDLREGIIRVLHSLSFVDDPTRILRAVRLASRLGFTIEPRTAELIGHALPLLDRVSGERIRHEIELLLLEADPGRAMAHLAEIGALSHIHPGLVWDRWLEERYRQVPQALDEPWQVPAEERLLVRVRVKFALLLLRLEAADVEAVLRRLNIRRATEMVVRQARIIHDRLPVLSQPIRNSEIAHYLEKMGLPALITAWLVTDHAQAQANLLAYWTVLRQVHPVTTGADLQALGIRPGPVYGEIMDRLRDTRLDGVVDAAGELEWVQEYLARREAAQTYS